VLRSISFAVNLHEKYCLAIILNITLPETLIFLSSRFLPCFGKKVFHPGALAGEALLPLFSKLALLNTFLKEENKGLLLVRIITGFPVQYPAPQNASTSVDGA